MTPVVLLMVVLGLVIGLLLGLLGSKGAPSSAMPALVYGAGLPLETAVPTSLLVVGISSASALTRRLKDIQWRLAGILSLTGAIGAIGGASCRIHCVGAMVASSSVGEPALEDAVPAQRRRAAGRPGYRLRQGRDGASRRSWWRPGRRSVPRCGRGRGTTPGAAGSGRPPGRARAGRARSGRTPRGRAPRRARRCGASSVKPPQRVTSTWTQSTASASQQVARSRRGRSRTRRRRRRRGQPARTVPRPVEVVGADRFLEPGHPELVEAAADADRLPAV